jgi:DNA-binding NarL/FixJ family response regulator
MGRLTRRDLELLAAVIDADGTKGAAAVLGMSPGNLRARISRIHAKVGLSSTTSVVWHARHELETLREGPTRPVDGPGREEGAEGG